MATNEDGQSRQEIIDYYVESGDDLDLVREPTNPVDKNAIAVYISKGNSKLRMGYLSADLAERYSAAIDNKSLTITLEVIEKTGETKGNLGVNCHFEAWTRDEIKAESARLEADKILREREIRKARYKVSTWRQIVGLLLILTFLMLIISMSPSIGEFLTIFAVFFIPSIFLLYPWCRWLIDMIKLLIQKLSNKNV